jgi:hypothetical protein
VGCTVLCSTEQPFGDSGDNELSFWACGGHAYLAFVGLRAAFPLVKCIWKVLCPKYNTSGLDICGHAMTRHFLCLFKEPVLWEFRSPSGHWWFTPVILATWEAEIGRILVWSQQGQIVQETLPPPPAPK